MARKASLLSIKTMLLFGMMFDLLIVPVTGEVTYGRVRLRTRQLLQFEADPQETLDFDKAARSRWTKPGTRWKLGMVDNVPSASNIDTDQREQRDLARHQLDRYTAGFADPTSMGSGTVEGGPHDVHRQDRITHPLSSKYRFSAGYQADPNFPDAASGVEWTNDDAAPQPQQGGWSEDIRGRSESAFTDHSEAVPWDTPVFNPEAVPHYHQPVHAQPRAAIPPLPVNVKFLRDDEDAWPSRASLGLGRRIESFPTLQNQPGREYEDAIIRRTLMPLLPSTVPSVTKVETGRKTEAATWKATDSATWKAVDTTTSKAILTTLKITTSTTPKAPLTSSKSVPKATPNALTTTTKSTAFTATPSTTRITSTAYPKVTSGATKIITTTKGTVSTSYATPTPKDTSTTPKIMSTTPKVTSAATPNVPSTTPKVPSTTPKVPSTTPKVTSTTPKVTSTTPKVTSTTPKVTSTTHKVTQPSALANDTNSKDKAITELNTKAEYKTSLKPEVSITTEDFSTNHGHNVSEIDTSTMSDYDEDQPSIGTVFGLSEDFTDDHMTVQFEYPSTISESNVVSKTEEPSMTDGSTETASEVAVVSEYTASEDFAGTIAPMLHEFTTFPSNFKESLDNLATQKPFLSTMKPPNMSEMTPTKVSNFSTVELVNMTTSFTTRTSPILETEDSTTSTMLTASVTTTAPTSTTNAAPTATTNAAPTATTNAAPTATTNAAPTVTTNAAPTATTNAVPTAKLLSIEQTQPPQMESTKLPSTELANTQLTDSTTQGTPNPTTQSIMDPVTVSTPHMTSPSAPAARPTSRRRLPSYRPIIRHRVNRPPDVSPSAPSNHRPATRRPPKASRIPTTKPPPPTTTMSDEEEPATDWFTPPMPTEPTTTKRQYVITVPPLVDHMEPRRHNNDDNEIVVDPSAESTHGATVAEDDGQHHSGVIPEGATNAIIISGIIGGCAIVFFAVLMAFCMWRQHMSRQPIYPPSNSSTSTSSSGTFNGRFR